MEEKTAAIDNKDIAGKEYWSKMWSESSSNKLYLDYNLDNFDRHIKFKFHKKFSKLVAQFDLREKKALEVGCAMSHWLPYFAREHSMQITGLDYSEVGCEKQKELVKMYGLEADIICADMSSPPESLIGQFDLVYSMGVVEHFSDTKECVEALAKFLKPGGVLITEIPYLKGWIGAIQAKIGPQIFAKHFPLDKEDLAIAHDIKSLEVLECDYFTFFNGNIWVVDENKHKLIKTAFRVANALLKRILWLADKMVAGLPANKYTSAYVLCVAKKL